MSGDVKKIMLVGWDGAPPQMIEQMLSKGLLKNVAGLMDRGTFIYAMNPYPTITASNWTTLSTGAWPGRHGVTGYNVHHPGEPLDRIYSGFNTGECSAEHIWDSAEKIGMKCVLVHYETSWPPTLKEGIVVGGCGPNYQDDFHKITPDLVFTTEMHPGISPPVLVEIGKTEGKRTAALAFKTASDEERTYFAEWSDGGRHIKIFKDKARRKLLASAEEGAWSAPASDTFLFEGKTVDAVFKFKLLQLPDQENRGFMLLCTSIVPTDHFTHPSHIGRELIEKLGPYYPRGGWESSVTVGPEHFLDYIDMYHEWLSEACLHLLRDGSWDLLYTQTHCHDYAHHLYMRCYDPITGGKGPRSVSQCEGYMEKAYESADRMLGKILEAADDETLVVVVSDHGATTWLADVDIRRILIDAGLMAVDEAGAVIWEKTRAVPQRACYVYVNTKDRDPQGIVPRGEEYEKVRDSIIEAFYDYRDPTTKKRPFSLVLKSEDARVLGLHGDRIGDIVYALHPEYGHEHGQGLSTGRYGRGSLESVIVLAGPGIRKGHKHIGMTGIQDVVPTLCYMADIPFPSGCEGAIIFDALEDPSCKMRGRLELEKELLRWKEAYEKMVSITHSRF